MMIPKLASSLGVIYHRTVAAGGRESKVDGFVRSCGAVAPVVAVVVSYYTAYFLPSPPSLSRLLLSCRCCCRAPVVVVSKKIGRWALSLPELWSVHQGAT